MASNIASLTDMALDWLSAPVVLDAGIWWTAVVEAAELESGEACGSRLRRYKISSNG